MQGIRITRAGLILFLLVCATSVAAWGAARWFQPEFSVAGAVVGAVGIGVLLTLISAVVHLVRSRVAGGRKRAPTPPDEANQASS